MPGANSLGPSDEERRPRTASPAIYLIAIFAAAVIAASAHLPSNSSEIPFHVIVALLFVFLLAGTFASNAALSQHLLEEERQQTGRCIACGYDLRASAGRCPECGTEKDEIDPAALPPARLR